MTALYEPVEKLKVLALYEEARAALTCPEKEQQTLMQGFPPRPEERVTKENWTSAPFSQWGFRHASRLLPTATVFAGEVEPSYLPERLIDLDRFRFTSSSSEQVTLAEHLQATHSDAFLVMRKGEVIYERYFRGQSPVDRHITFSVTQAFVGILAEELIYRGRLIETAQVREYVPDLEGSAFADATIRNLMDMSVGIDYLEDYESPFSSCSAYGYACGMLSPPEGLVAQASVYDYLMSLRKSGEHGGFFQYVTANSEVLAWAMERATGLSFPQMVQQLWRKLGCERDGYFISDAWGRGVAGAGFSATLRDLARFGAMVANSGRYQGRALLPQQVLGSISAGADPNIYAKHADYSRWTPGASYRSQWYVFNNPGPALLASGIYGQYLYVDMKTQTVIVKQSSQPEAVGMLEVDTVRLLRALGSR